MTPVNDDEIPLPEGDLLTRTVVKPTDISLRGDVDAGWLLNQMDAAGANLARQIAKGKVTTVAIGSMVFMRPIPLDSTVSVYGQCIETGRTSIRVQIEVWLQQGLNDEAAKVTEAEFVFVAVDDDGLTRRFESDSQ